MEQMRLKSLLTNSQAQTTKGHGLALRNVASAGNSYRDDGKPNANCISSF